MTGDADADAGDAKGAVGRNAEAEAEAEVPSNDDGGEARSSAASAVKKDSSPGRKESSNDGEATKSGDGRAEDSGRKATTHKEEEEKEKDVVVAVPPKDDSADAAKDKDETPKKQHPADAAEGAPKKPTKDTEDGGDVLKKSKSTSVEESEGGGVDAKGEDEGDPAPPPPSRKRPRRRTSNAGNDDDEGDGHDKSPAEAPVKVTLKDPRPAKPSGKEATKTEKGTKDQTGTSTRSSKKRPRQSNPAEAQSASAGGNADRAAASSAPPATTTTTTTTTQQLTMSNLHTILYSPATSLNSNLSMIPTIEQMTNWTTKNLTESPPFVHLSSRDSSAHVKILEGPVHRRLTLRGPPKGGYRMSRASHGVSPPPPGGGATAGSTDAGGTGGGAATSASAAASSGMYSGYYFEVEVLEDQPSATEILENLPPNARLGPDLRRELEEKILSERAREVKEAATAAASSSAPQTTTPAANNTATSRRQPKTKKSEPMLGSHLRLGWSMRTADLQAPVGYDKWSYGIRDVNCSRVHASQREDRWCARRIVVQGPDDGEEVEVDPPSFGPGDIVGFAIVLPAPPVQSKGGGGGSTGRHHRHHHASSKKHRSKELHSSAAGTTVGGGAEVGKSDDGRMTTSSSRAAAAASEPPPPSTVNHLRFFRNGEPLGGDCEMVNGRLRSGGMAYADDTPDDDDIATLVSGTYYPAISSYLGGTVRVNFGPHFVYPPNKPSRLPTGGHRGVHVRPVSDLCPQPPMPDDAVASALKSKGFPKRTDEAVVTAFRDAVRTETTLRRKCYEDHLARHVEEVRAARVARRLPTADLPDPPPPTKAEEEGKDTKAEEGGSTAMTKDGGKGGPTRDMDDATMDDASSSLSPPATKVGDTKTDQ